MSDVSPALSALYASERAASGVSTTDRERILGQVLTSVGVVAAAGTATATGTASAATTGTAAVAGITGKLVVLIFTLGALGGGTAAVLHSGGDEDEPPPRASQVAPVAALNIATDPPAIAAPVVEAARVSTTGVEVVAEPVRRAKRRAVPVPGVEPTVPVEPDARRLARAWTLYAHGDAHGSLALLDELAGSNDLAEERDALRVSVLARLDRVDDARTAATAFLARFPTSVYRATVTNFAARGKTSIEANHR